MISLFSIKPQEYIIKVTNILLIITMSSKLSEKSEILNFAIVDSRDFTRIRNLQGLFFHGVLPCFTLNRNHRRRTTAVRSIQFWLLCSERGFLPCFLTTAIRKCFATHYEKQNGEQLFQIQPWNVTINAWVTYLYCESLWHWYYYFSTVYCENSFFNVELYCQIFPKTLIINHGENIPCSRTGYINCIKQRCWILPVIGRT